MKESWNIDLPYTIFTTLKRVRKKYNLSNPVIVRIPNKYKNLVESLEIYDHGLIGSNFIVNFSSSDFDIIMVDNIQLKSESKKELMKYE